MLELLVDVVLVIAVIGVSLGTVEQAKAANGIRRNFIRTMRNRAHDQSQSRKEFERRKEVERRQQVERRNAHP